MRRVAFAATFNGSATPANEAGTELTANTRAARLIPLDGDLPQGVGPGATFESTVVIGQDGKFAEHGAIDLGGGNTIRFSEVSPGTLLPAPDGRAAGSIDWKVDSSTGVLEGASGYITSNFSVGESGDVTDHQLVSLLLP